MINILHRTFGRRQRCLIFEADAAVPRPVVEEALSGQGEALVVKAVQQLIRDRMAAALTDSSMPDNLNVPHALGRLAELAELRGELLLLTRGKANP